MPVTDHIIKHPLPAARVDRDGHNGWSRRSAVAWERVFGPSREHHAELRLEFTVDAQVYSDPNLSRDAVIGFTEDEDREHHERARHAINRQFYGGT